MFAPQCGTVPLAFLPPWPATPPFSPAWTASMASSTLQNVSGYEKPHYIIWSNIFISRTLPLPSVWALLQISSILSLVYYSLKTSPSLLILPEQATSVSFTNHLNPIPLSIYQEKEFSSRRDTLQTLWSHSPQKRMNEKYFILEASGTGSSLTSF